MASESRFPGMLRQAARIAVPAGAAAALGLVLYAGRHNASWLLRLLFAGWVVSPFAAAAVAVVAAQRWAVVTRAALNFAILVFTLGSLAIYADIAFAHPGARIGFVFLVVPLASWLLMSIAVLAAALSSPRRP